jgi:hypothetical protein
VLDTVTVRLRRDQNRAGLERRAFERPTGVLAALSEDASAVGAVAHSVPKPIRSNLETARCALWIRNRFRSGYVSYFWSTVSLASCQGTCYEPGGARHIAGSSADLGVNLAPR